MSTLKVSFSPEVLGSSTMMEGERDLVVFESRFLPPLAQFLHFQTDPGDALFDSKGRMPWSLRTASGFAEAS